MKIKLTYFRKGGKYYSDDEYETSFKDLYDVWDEVREKRRMGVLPGLMKDACEFIILIDAPEHEHNHPRLIV